MKLELEWARQIQLRDGRRQNLIYILDVNKLPRIAGLYVLARRFGNGFEALYVGKAGNIKSRIKDQLNNLRLMQHLRNAKLGRRIVLTARFIGKPGQKQEKCLKLLERALIRHFLSEGHDLVNKQGTRLRRHEIFSRGKHPKRVFPHLMYVEMGSGN